VKIPGVPALKRPKGIGVRHRPRLPSMPKTPQVEPVTAAMDERTKRAYYALCGEETRRAEIANRFAKLLLEFPAMTLPEAIFYILLQEREVSFDYQSAFDGGRAELGGYVVDFVLRMGSYALAVLVNGDYWHTLPSQVLRDFATKERVTGQYFEDLLIAQTLEVWESTLLSCDRERAVDLLLIGIEVGRTA